MKDRETWLKELKVGDKIWCAQYERHALEDVLCPVCFGKCVVTLVLGNDDKVVLPCEYCGHGMNAPTGYKKEYQTKAAAEQRCITSIAIKQDGDGEMREYMTGYQYWTQEKIFQTEQEANAKADELAAKDMDSEAATAAVVKKNHWRSYAWNAGYHMTGAKDCRKQAERHEQMAQICRGRSKDLKGDRGDEQDTTKH